MFILVCEVLCVGKLKGGVVGILMSNMSLEFLLKEFVILFVCVNVGDCYVFE